jgi:hypothetical protein
VTVGTTTTGAPGTNASVTNSGTAQNAVLDFTIPAGQPSGLSAYGGLYNTTTQTITPTAAGTYDEVSLNTPMPLLNVTGTANTLTITEPGDYEVSYSLLITGNLLATITAAVRNNGAVIPATVKETSLISNSLVPPTFDALFNTSVIVTLAANDIIDVAISATGTLPIGLNITVGSGSGASLIVKKIN